MSTLTIAVADYFKSEVTQGALSQNQVSAGVAKPKLQSHSKSSSSIISTSKKTPMLLSDLPDMSSSPLLRSAPAHSGSLSSLATLQTKMNTGSLEDVSSDGLWVRMKNETAEALLSEKISTDSSSPFMSLPGPLITTRAARTEIVSDSPAAKPQNMVQPTQKEYVCLDEVKQVIQAATPVWTIPNLESGKSLNNNALRAALAAKSAASFDLEIKKLPASVATAIPVKLTGSVVSTPSSPGTITPPPLRKLKLSLKVSALTKLYSTSNISPKSVRFASRIANVKTFDGRDSPSTVSLQNSPSGSPTYSFSGPDYFSVRHNFTELGFSDDDDDVSSDSDNVYQEYTKDKHYKITRSNFVAPKNIYDKRDCPVYLQQATLSSDKKLMVLLVMALNLAFEKKLSVKLTLNNWNSVLIFNNYTYMKLFTSVNYDQFQFVIPFSHFPSSISPQFCIRYDVNNTTYWDNNQEKNYSFSLTAVQEVSKDSSTFFKSSKPVGSNISSSLNAVNTFTPTFSTYNQFTTGSQNSAPVTKPFNPVFPKSTVVGSSSGPKPSSYSLGNGSNHNELINKLLEAKTESETDLSSKATAGSAPLRRPVLTHTHSLPSLPSAAIILSGPRYSQSYLAKRSEPLSASIKSDSPAGTSVVPATAATNTTANTNSKAQTNSEVPRSIGGIAKSASSSDFSNTKFNSSSYAALLANYCFNGADATMGSCPMESLAGSRASSSSSVNSDFMGPSLSSFHSLSDSFHV